MKKTMTAAMALGCCLAAFGGGTATWTDSSNVPWIFMWQDNGTATIGNGLAPSAENKAKYAGSVVLPATVYRDGEPYKVTAIEANALNGCTLMESVTIPAGVASIGNAAFKGCTSLEHVTFKSTFPTSSNFANVFEGTKFYTNANAENANDSVNFPALFPSDGSVKTVKDSNFLASVCGTEEDWASISTDYSGCVTKWFSWTPQKSGTVWFDTADSVFDTLLYVYRADTKTEVAKNNDFTKTGGSQVMFNAEAGVEYYICVGGKNGERGAYTLALRTGTPVTLTLDPNGGAFSGADVPTKFSVPKNVAVGVLPTPVKDGYACAWYTAKSGGTKVTASTKFTKATKLYARWTKNKFKVVVKTEGAGAKAVKGSGTYAWGTKVKLSATPKSGYVFMYWIAQNSASENAFPNYSKTSRKNATATVTVPKNSGLAYTAYFVKKTSDGMSLGVFPSTTLYAEDGVGSAVTVYATAMSYPTVKTSKLPAGVKFSLDTPDDTYKLVITDPDKIPAGKNVIKITATNRSGKKDSKSVTVWGKNKRQAIDKNALYVSEGGLSAKAPKEIYTGVKYKLVDWGVSTAMGWKVTKIAGLPSGITWDAKNQTLKGYTKKTGTYTFTFTVAKGKTKYTATATFKVKTLPAKVQGTFRGYAGEYNEFGTSFNGNSRRVTVSVTKDGKVSAKVGSLSLSCTGLTYDPSSGRFMAYMKSTSKTNKKDVTYIRSLSLQINPAADYFENSLDGNYCEYTRKQTSHSISENLVADYDIEGRKNVFGRDADMNPLFEGAGVAQEALEKAFSVYPYHVISFDGGSATVTLDSGKNGNVTLSCTYNGKSFSESAVLWYEVNPGDPSIRYLRFWSFSIGQPISYVLKYDGGILQTVSAPAVPEG